MKMLVKTKVIKRNGEEVGFDLEKIENAIRAANEEVDNIYKLLMELDENKISKTE